MLPGTDRIKNRFTSGGTSRNGTHRAPSKHHTCRRSSGPSLTGGSVVRSAQPVRRPPPTPFWLAIHFPRSSVIGRHAPTTRLRRLPGQGGSPQFPPPPSERSVRPYAGEFLAAAIQVLHRFHGLRPDPEGLGSPLCHPHG